jgi:hypothetical protein
LRVSTSLRFRSVALARSGQLRPSQRCKGLDTLPHLNGATTSGTPRGSRTRSVRGTTPASCGCHAFSPIELRCGRSLLSLLHSRTRSLRRALASQQH